MDNISDVPCIRNVQCQYFLETTSLRARCHQCSQFRETYLRCALRRCNEKDNNSICSPSSHTNYRFLDCAQLTERMKNMHSLLNKKSREHARLQEAVSQSIEKESLPLSNEDSADVRAMMERHSAKVLSECDEDTFQHIFWKQQLRAMTLKNKRSMRWHPLIIK